MNKEYLSVSDINKYIKGILDKDSFLNKIYLKGEISNFKRHSRGHLYFTLKDENSRISAVMFAGSTRSLTFEPADGMSVLVTGRISLYEATGNYQIYVEEMNEDGVGDLYIKFEELKKKLASEGLFLSTHKKKIPTLPKRIGIITAPTGAAVRDIITTINRRFPLCETLLFPSLVQGEGAKEDIVKNIKEANKSDVDVIILGRGGGSIEDLWAFNEEIVARAIFDSDKPIISAVGHEIDFTISDFVSDLRAPTPTAAAELAVPEKNEVKKAINNFVNRINDNIKNLIIHNREKVHRFETNYILNNPYSIYEVKEQKLDMCLDKLNNIIINVLDSKKYEFNNLTTKVELLNPVSILNKGYSIVTKKDKIVKSISDVKVNDEISIKIKKGSINAIVKEVNK